MPLGRAFTRRLRSESSALRTFITASGKAIKPGDISLPTSLLSTTNPLSHDAPDVAVAQLAAAQGKFDTTAGFMTFYHDGNKNAPNSRSESPPALDSSRSSEESDSPKFSSPSTPPTATPTLTDASSVDSSPADSSPALEYNHLSCYFPKQTVRRSKSVRSATTTAGQITAEIDAQQAPALPSRVSSHNKREHERLARKRSLRRSGSGASKNASSSAPIEPTSETSGLVSIDTMIGQATASPTKDTNEASSPLSPESVYSPVSPVANAMQHHPFTSELEQLNEVAEEFHGITQEAQAAQEAKQVQKMKEKGLQKFNVADYVREIGWLYNPSDGGYIW